MLRCLSLSSAINLSQPTGVIVRPCSVWWIAILWISFPASWSHPTPSRMRLQSSFGFHWKRWHFFFGDGQNWQKHGCFGKDLHNNVIISWYRMMQGLPCNMNIRLKKWFSWYQYRSVKHGRVLEAWINRSRDRENESPSWTEQGCLILVSVVCPKLHCFGSHKFSVTAASK